MMESSETKQSAHTQGQWAIFERDHEHFVMTTTSTGRPLLTICKCNEQYAERIVKCVNIHDELVEGIKQIIAYANQRGKGTPLPRILNRMKDKAIELLEQAEQE